MPKIWTVGLLESYMLKKLTLILPVISALILPKFAEAAGTPNFVSKFITPSTVGDSLLYDDGSSVGFGTTTPGILHPGTFTLLTGTGASFIELGSNRTTTGGVGVIYFVDPTSADGDQDMAFIQSNTTVNPPHYVGQLQFGTKPVGGTARVRMTIDQNGNTGFSVDTPKRFISLNGLVPRTLGMDPNTMAGGAGQALTINAGASNAGSTDLRGGDLVLATGVGTGLGGGGNSRIQTAGAEDLSGTTANTLVDREILVGKAKQMTLNSPGFSSLMSILLTGTHTAGGRIFYTIRATDGGSQIATEEGVIQYLATANTITCTVQTTDKLHLGTVNSGCTPGFFNPGAHPGISIFDNVSFNSPAPIVVHEVYFKIDNNSGSAIRLEP